jgi:3-oxoacyl-[acyl-carrier protein] reductase
MKDGSSIVNVSSLRGLFDHGRPPILDYSVSKAGVISFTKTLAKELAPKIRVNCVSPGMTNTDVIKKYSREQLDQFVKTIYLGRLIEPIEIAKTIVFLSSDDASGITGVNLPVDGGQSLGK